jgi:hypothetical protein
MFRAQQRLTRFFEGLTAMNQSRESLTSLSPVFYDIEASSLAGFPIEIGWAQVTPSFAISAESHLVHHFGWHLSRRWCKEAERIHGISRADIRARGRPPYQLALHMNAALGGRQLFADSGFDEHWLRMIFEAAGVEPAFTVRRMLSDALVGTLAAGKTIASSKLAELLADAARSEPRTHRAGQDARHLAAQWRAVLEYQQR